MICGIQGRWKTLLDCLGREVEIQSLDKAYRGHLTELGWERLLIMVSGAGLVQLRPDYVKQIRTLPPACSAT